jgi:NAD-dependent protein deacetylases, SIR2 family
MDYKDLKSIINSSTNIVFFGGAGVSTESSIPDFRSEAGLYKTKGNFSYPPEVMLSHSFFLSHTEDFFDFYKTKMIYRNAKPNAAHYALAELEKRDKLKAVITQNIDGLHQLADSKNVLELHGSIHRNYCMKCGKSFDLDYVVSSKTIIPKCDICNGTIKPDVVLYEESLDMNILNNSINHIKSADLLIVGGTSLVVYPASGLIDYFNGKNLILINKSSTPYDNKADLVIHDNIGITLHNIL